MFKSRQEAAQLLAQKLQKYKGKKAIILAIPRGGVVTGAVLAEKLSLPLDVLVTRKIGAPGHEELAVGAVGPGKIKIVDWPLAQRVGASSDYLKLAAEEQYKELTRRLALYRGKKTLPKLKNKTVILTDDGIATGSTVEVAIAWIKTQKPKKLVLAIPVAPPDTTAKLQEEVDELVVLDTPSSFFAVGQFYREFPQVSDKEVIRLLKKQ